MNHAENWMNGWMGGRMWISPSIGILLVILLIMAISNFLENRPTGKIKNN